jgi:hypothetical protein
VGSITGSDYDRKYGVVGVLTTTTLRLAQLSSTFVATRRPANVGDLW